MRTEKLDVFQLDVFRGPFYWLLLTEAIFQISENIGLCISPCINIIVVSAQDKSMKKIT